jgi:DNA polymerase-4
MLIHYAIPGFYAAVHQAHSPSLRGRPVAVAIAQHEQSPLFAVSAEARDAGVHPGMRAAAAQRRCRQLQVLTPDQDLYRRAQRAAAALCTTYTPCTGGRSGRFDLDLHGTETLWRRRLRPGAPVEDALEQGLLIARALTTASAQLHLPAYAGVGARLTTARLAARLAREPAYARSRVVAIAPEQQERLLDPLPLGWLPDCQAAATSALSACGITTIGDARELGASALTRLLGEAAAPLLAALGDDEERVVPDIADPEPGVTVSRHCGPGGANPERAEALLAGLGRELGFALRTRAMACGAIALEGRWLDGRGVVSTHRARRQLRHDDELAQVAQELCGKRERRVNWERFSLTATALCAAEEQLELFAPLRSHRLEDARDVLRRRFGNEVVSPLRQAV